MAVLQGCELNPLHNPLSGKGPIYLPISIFYILQKSITCTKDAVWKKHDTSRCCQGKIYSGSIIQYLPPHIHSGYSFGRISLTCLPAPSLWISGNEEFDQPSLSSCFSAGHWLGHLSWGLFPLGWKVSHYINSLLKFWAKLPFIQKLISLSLCFSDSHIRDYIFHISSFIFLCSIKHC